ncbi:hypothetical protein C5O80_34270 [Burkholderia sp. SRS-46]|nr:hypothetical protein C5O80_34270 [Burkholderia sp. SRS-46]
MSDQVNPLSFDEAAGDGDASKPFQLSTATRIVPMQRDHLGRPYWESYHTPTSFEVRAECRVPPHMPGVIIFVHGVNSTGEWYDAAEEALCEGLNERLNRSDLKSNTYSANDGARNVPRHIDKQNKGNSPVIRFFWGYSAVPGTERKWRIPLRNLDDSDFWASHCTSENGPWVAGDVSSGPWFWGGGPFQNGTNNLLQLWSEAGFERHIVGFDMERLNTEADRQLQDSPPRNYYAHAARRLADLIDMIRTECPRDTVTVMSHSQGTMIAMAATALCTTRAPDALFVMNSPYALDDKITDALACGADRPTTEARVNTFQNIALRIKRDKRVMTEAQIRQLQCGASEDMDFWRPDNKRQSGVHERDNHGRLYVYFTPHDRVMGATPLKSIGWQGLDAKLLAELGDTVKQRMLARGTPVGDEPGVKKFGTLPPTPEDKLVPGAKPTDFWNGNRNIFTPLLTLWAVPHPDKTVTINAERVPQPVTADEMRLFDNSRKDVDAMGNWVPDPNDPDTGSYAGEDYRFMRSIYQPKLNVVMEDIYTSRDTTRRESQDEMLERLDAYNAEPTNHSTLPKNQEFMRRVAAYDLPIGFCDAYERTSLWTSLMKLADWTQGDDPYFLSGKTDTVPKPPIIDWDTVAAEQSRTEGKRLAQQQYGGSS